MKKLGITVSGNNYEIKLDDSFADFVNKDLEEAGINLLQDNKPDQLLKAYLRLAKEVSSYEKEIETIIQSMED